MVRARWVLRVVSSRLRGPRLLVLCAQNSTMPARLSAGRPHGRSRARTGTRRRTASHGAAAVRRAPSHGRAHARRRRRASARRPRRLLRDPTTRHQYRRRVAMCGQRHWHMQPWNGHASSAVRGRYRGLTVHQSPQRPSRARSGRACGRRGARHICQRQETSTKPLHATIRCRLRWRISKRLCPMRRRT